MKFRDSMSKITKVGHGEVTEFFFQIGNEKNSDWTICVLNLVTLGKKLQK